MPIIMTTNTDDVGPWVLTQALGWDPEERSVTQRFYLNDLALIEDPDGA